MKNKKINFLEKFKNQFSLLTILLFVFSFVMVSCEKDEPDDFFNINIIKNGDAEEGPAVPIDGTRQLPKHWSDVEGKMWISKYGEGAGSELAEADVRGKGDNYFWGGKNTNSTIEQIVDVSPIQQEIDAGNVSYELSGLLGGYRSQNDRAKLTADFLDTGSDIIQSTQINFVTNVDRDNVTRMVRKVSTGTVPISTRKIRFRLIAVLEEGANSDGYADELSMLLRK